MDYSRFCLGLATACLFLAQSANALAYTKLPVSDSVKSFYCECNCLKCEEPGATPPCAIPSNRIDEPFTKEQIDAGECNPDACVRRNALPERCYEDTKILTRVRLLELPLTSDGNAPAPTSPPSGVISSFAFEPSMAPPSTGISSFAFEPSPDVSSNQGGFSGGSAAPAPSVGKASQTAQQSLLPTLLGAFLASALIGFNL